MRSPILSEKQYFSAHHTLISTISTTNTKATASWIPQPHIFFSHPQKKPFIFFFLQPIMNTDNLNCAWRLLSARLLKRRGKRNIADSFTLKFLQNNLRPC